MSNKIKAVVLSAILGALSLNVHATSITDNRFVTPTSSLKVINKCIAEPSNGSPTQICKTPMGKLLKDAGYTNQVPLDDVRLSINVSYNLNGARELYISNLEVTSLTSKPITVIGLILNDTDRQCVTSNVNTLSSINKTLDYSESVYVPVIINCGINSIKQLEVVTTSGIVVYNY